MNKIDAYSVIKYLKVTGHKANDAQIAGILKIADKQFCGDSLQAAKIIVTAAYHPHHPGTDPLKLVSQNTNALKLLGIDFHASNKFYRFVSFGKKHRIKKSRDAIFNFITNIHAFKIRHPYGDMNIINLVKEVRGELLMQAAGMGGHDHPADLKTAWNNFLEVLAEKTGINWLLIHIGKLLK